MRYRVKTYTAFIPPEQDMITIAFPIPDKVAALLESHKTLPYGTLDATGQKMMTDALRVIADETQGGYILAATGAKNNIRDVYWYYNSTPTLLQFNFVFETLIQHAITQDDLAAIAALATTDQFTIEMDFGDLPPEYLESTEDAKALAEFFGVTLLQGYEFMTDTEVTDELEDIMQALDPELTAEQAASITAQAMQIINPSES